MAEQRRLIAPLFNSEHLLSKPIPELVGSGFNLRVQLSVQHSSFDRVQCGRQVFFRALYQLHSRFQLTWAAIKISSGGADTAVTCKSFQNMDGCAFVGKVC